ncbi:MAG: UDP-3-O-(3-hydroxymyristoyl)glucosamine N-acyltransferase [Pseudohongiella sp.]|nr:UDP-3-O-(3-hydroxymyristoyl)glucosamine N-acyltransferase [Pseudohongiella sp.]MDO9519188.1 UDP-3-O-(3-hydroxymyristoyl)glucosamine N-acyltransferase [Pseudohongiella sp.]MDP2128749.1 UDP-3-O-(3-hydroxymyristoyl)glucosamine N-acyltransferase [Pseudohongiella sp.]
MTVVFTLGELSSLLDVPVRASTAVVPTDHASGHQGAPELLRIDGLATLENAVAGKLSFLSNPRYARQLKTCRASALIIHPDLAAGTTLPCLLSTTPYVTYAKASQLFASAMAAQRAGGPVTPAIHPSAIISEHAVIGASVRIGAHAVIEAGTVIADGCQIGAGCYVGSAVVIGRDTVIYPNVTLYHEVVVGERVIVHSGVVLGADGFGFAFDGQRSVKIAQLGSVRIGSDVEIGAGSSIDRGALDDTVIGNGVKIDNQVQIGHNCVVGDHTVICGCSALAGSTRIGRYCVIGGGVGVTGHLSITDRVTVSAMSMVTQSIDKPGLYSSGTLLQESAQWKRNAVTLGKLSGLSRTVRNIERQLQQSGMPEQGNENDDEH